MIEHHIVAQYIVIAGLPQFKTKVHVIVGNRHGFVQSAHFLVLFLRHHQAGRRHTDHIISHTAAAVIIILIVLKSHQLMRRADLQIRDARMLDQPAARIPQPGSHRAHMRQKRLPHHAFQPVFLDDLNIVVQQQDHVPMCPRHAHIAHFRKVKRHFFI